MSANLKEKGVSQVELRSTGIFQFAGDGRITRVDSFKDPRVAAERLAEERG
jgi:hypothetical protein